MLRRIGRYLVSKGQCSVTSRRLYTNKTTRTATSDSAIKSKQNKASELEENTIDNPDVFGTLSQRGCRSLATQEVERFYPDDKDGYDKEEYDLTPRKNAYYYKYEINKYARQGSAGLRKALELYREMKSEARLRPNQFNFGPLLYGCARAGYTKRAFDIHEESLKYQSKPTDSNVTCLLNACAECPFPEYGLKRLDWFRTELKSRFNISLNLVQYNAAIKAYGKLGRLDQASEMVQEMIEDGIQPDLFTFQSLLIGCASDKESGCAMALRVFKRLKLYDIKPDTNTYRLMLRCIRDCGLGSVELIHETLRELPAMTSLDQRLLYRKRVPQNEKKLRRNFEWTPLISDLGVSIAKALSQPQPAELLDGSKVLVQSQSEPELSSKRTGVDGNNMKNLKLKVTNECDDGQQHVTCNSSLVADRATNETNLPNVLSDDHLDLMLRIEGLQFDKLRTRYQRFVLFGGLEGFIQTMLKDGCKPDIKTLNLIMFSVQPTKDDLTTLFELSESLKIKRDVDFYDQLIYLISKNLSNKNRLELAMHFLEKLHLDNLRPTINTFEALAGSCDTWSQAQRMIADLEGSGLVVSDTMISSFYWTALKRRNLYYLVRLVEYSQSKGYEPSKRLIESLEAYRVSLNELLAKQEKGLLHTVLDEKAIMNFERFTASLDKWLEVANLRNDAHPWEQFNISTRSKKHEYFEFVRHLKVMDKVKTKALEKGDRSFGNIYEETDRLLKEDKQLLSSN